MRLLLGPCTTGPRTAEAPSLPRTTPRPSRRTLSVFAAAGAVLVLGAGCSSSRPAVAHAPVRAQAVVAASPVAVEPSAARGRVDVDAMPQGDLTGWKQVMAEDFSRPALPSGWGAYHGAPGGNPRGWWEQSRVAVRDGSLRLSGAFDRNGTYTTGGVMAWAARTTYGKYEVRFRVTKAAGATYALLLWPSTGTWPSAGEIDFAEDGGGDRATTTATLHSGANDDRVQRTLDADFSSWQTVGVEWTPRRLVYTLNGRPWATVAGAAVPSGPMDLALQLEAGRGDQWRPAPTAATPASTLEVDWAVAYRRA